MPPKKVKRNQIRQLVGLWIRLEQTNEAIVHKVILPAAFSFLQLTDDVGDRQHQARFASVLQITDAGVLRYRHPGLLHHLGEPGKRQRLSDTFCHLLEKHTQRRGIRDRVAHDDVSEIDLAKGVVHGFEPVDGIDAFGQSAVLEEFCKCATDTNFSFHRLQFTTTILYAFDSENSEKLRGKTFSVRKRPPRVSSILRSRIRTSDPVM